MHDVVQMPPSPDHPKIQFQSSRKKPLAMTIKLPEKLDTKAAGDLAALLNQKRGQTVVLDAAHVVFVGARAAEVLVAAFRDWHGNDIGFTFVNAVPGFTQGIELLGIAPSELGLDTRSAGAA